MQHKIEHLKWFRLNWIRYDYAEELALAFCNNFNMLDDPNAIESVPEWVVDLAEEFMKRRF